MKALRWLPVALLAGLLSVPAMAQDDEGGRRRGGRGGERGERGGERGDRGDRGGDRGGRGGGSMFGGRGGGSMFGGRGGGGSMLGLLSIEEVQKEIKVDEDQLAAVKKLRDGMRGERMDFSKIREASEEERQKMFAEMREKGEKRAKEATEQLEMVLMPGQLDRLREIWIQTMGLTALQNKEIAEELKITSEQTEKIKKAGEEIQTTMREKFQEMREGGGGFSRENFAEMREKMQEMMGTIRKDHEDKVMGVLTSDQKKQFEKMKGEKFEMPERRGGPGGGRPQFGGGQRGQRGGEGGGRGGRPRGEDF